MTTRSCPTVTTQGVPKARCGAVLPMVVTAHGQLSPGLTYERCHLIFGTDRAHRSDSAGKTSRSPAGCRLSLVPRASNFRRPAGSTHRLSGSPLPDASDERFAVRQHGPTSSSTRSKRPAVSGSPWCPSPGRGVAGRLAHWLHPPFAVCAGVRAPNTMETSDNRG
jgi:hypothetical protein